MNNNTTKALLPIMVLLISFSLNAQTLFNSRYGSSFSDVGNAICVTNDSGFAVVGISSANGAGGDIFFMKLNQHGVIQWQKNIFGVNLEQILGVYQLPNGNYILGGNTYSYGSGCWDAFEVMLDATGSLIWSKAYGDVNCNSINDFSLAHGNGFIGCGLSTGVANGGWLLKTDQNGLIEWSKYYTTTSGFFSVKPTSDGGYLAVGTNGSITILKTDSTGNPTWFQQYLSSPGNTTCYDLVTFDDGTAALVGQVYLNAYGGISDVFLMKIDPIGNLIWFKSYGYTFEEKGLSVQKTYDSGFFISGYTNSFGHGDDDALLLKTDNSGNLTWAKTYGGAWYDRAEQVQTLSDSGFVFVGTSNSTANSDSSYIYVVRTDKYGNACEYLNWTPLQQTQTYPPTSQTSIATSFGVDSSCTATISNFLFTENNICTVTAISEITNENALIYPNPVTSVLSIKGLPVNSIISLFTLTGELILSQRAFEKSTVDFSKLEQGVYILRCEYGIRKIVKM